MPKKIAIYSLILLGVGIIYLSTSREMMKKISETRNEHDEWWGVHHATEGDLVGMSYLYYVPEFCGGDKPHFNKMVCNGNDSIHMVLWGDSYCYRIPPEAFPCAAPYRFGRRYFQTLKYRIDTNRKNVLVIEIAERYVLDYLSGTDMYRYVYKAEIDTVEDIKFENTEAGQPHNLHFYTEMVFNPYINQNLEYNVFNYNCINGIRKLKALLNYVFFSRASGNVCVSQNKQYLLLKETISNAGNASSYAPCTAAQLNSIIKTLNDIYAHYKNEGFDEVYLSIIPNPATILQSEGYNKLIPSIQNNTSLRMKIIDIYTSFTKTKKEVYRRGDTHWNTEGMNMWIGIVNEQLQR